MLLSYLVTRLLLMIIRIWILLYLLLQTLYERNDMHTDMSSS